MGWDEVGGGVNHGVNTTVPPVEFIGHGKGEDQPEHSWRLGGHGEPKSVD